MERLALPRTSVHAHTGVPRLILDAETYSTVDLVKAGAHAYAEHPTTGVHCVAWRVVGGMREARGLWTPGQPVPERVLEHLRGCHPVVAHNWLFERNIWEHQLTPRHGWPVIPTSLWSCTMARALGLGLPASLELLGEALELHTTKDKGARRLMLQLAKPRGVDPATGQVTWWHEDPSVGPDMLRQLYAYCERDVDAEAEADAALRELSPVERELFLLDGQINLTGIRISPSLVAALSRVADEELERLGQEMARATGGQIRSVNNAAALTLYLRGLGLPVASLDRAHMPELIELARATCPAAVAPLLLRQEGAKSSTAKLRSMMAAVSSDGRARGLFQFCGAGRTRRWAGRRVQPQNMPRPLLKEREIEQAIHLVMTGASAGELDMLFPCTPLELVSSLLRACLIPDAGHEFVSMDLSQIEARVIAWLAGQQDILDVFARDEDVYTYTAAKIGSDNRQLGKVLVLACGFGMGGPKFRATAALYGIQLTEDEARRLVYQWRDANPMIVTFWYALDRAFRDAIAAPDGTWTRLGKIQIGRTKRAVRIRLPSGGDLVYHRAEEQPEDPQDPLSRTQITYMGMHQQTNKWTRLRTYGGKLAENVTQAVARDILGDALRRGMRRGIGLTGAAMPVGSFHDEGLFEAPAHLAQAVFAAAHLAFTTPPPWAAGLPVGAAGWHGERYRKG